MRRLVPNQSRYQTTLISLNSRCLNQRWKLQTNPLLPPVGKIGFKTKVNRHTSWILTRFSQNIYLELYNLLCKCWNLIKSFNRDALVNIYFDLQGLGCELTYQLIFILYHNSLHKIITILLSTFLGPSWSMSLFVSKIHNIILCRSHFQL